jgi:hypothetical protein
MCSADPHPETLGSGPSQDIQPDSAEDREADDIEAEEVQNFFSLDISSTEEFSFEMMMPIQLSASATRKSDS